MLLLAEQNNRSSDRQSKRAGFAESPLGDLEEPKLAQEVASQFFMVRSTRVC